MFQIETATTIFELEFFHVQLNITSRCNMRCEHCRGAYCGAVDMLSDDFERLIAFASPHLISKAGGYLISGGEPLLHPKFKDFLIILRKQIRVNDFVTITTNGSFLDSEMLDFLEGLDFPDLRISISLDSTNPIRHNEFRHNPRAFDDAIRAIRLTSERSIQCMVRSTIQPDQFDELDQLADLAESLRADILSLSSIIPAGSAICNHCSFFDSESKRRLIERAVEMNKTRQITVDVNDPLSYIVNAEEGDTGVYGGCIAGIGAFSVEPDGTMLTCPLLPNQPIMNIIGASVEEIAEGYASSEFVHALIERQLTGKCGDCKLKFVCGGCRARAEGINGHYLAADPDCWI